MARMKQQSFTLNYLYFCSKWKLFTLVKCIDFFPNLSCEAPPRPRASECLETGFLIQSYWTLCPCWLVLRLSCCFLKTEELLRNLHYVGFTSWMYLFLEWDFKFCPPRPVPLFVSVLRPLNHLGYCVLISSVNFLFYFKSESQMEVQEPLLQLAWFLKSAELGRKESCLNVCYVCYLWALLTKGPTLQTVRWLIQGPDPIDINAKLSLIQWVQVWAQLKNPYMVWSIASVFI